MITFIEDGEKLLVIYLILIVLIFSVGYNILICFDKRKENSK